MPRAIWSGAISFGLLNVPVKLYSAVSPKTVRFHQLRASDGSRVRNKRVSEADGKEVSYEEIVKGFELGGDRHVVLTNEELAELEPEKTRAIDVEDFVALSEIDPIYFDHAYYLAPDTGSEKAYRLLVEAMRKSEKVAIARFVLRNREHLAALRAVDGAIAVATMRFHDEIVSPEELSDVLPDSDVETSDKEVRMAEQLIESLTTEFDPTAYRDTYRERLLDLIERKAAGEEVVTEPTGEAEPTAAPDLMAALEESLASVRAHRESAAGDGAPSKGSKKGSKKGSGKGAAKGSKQGSKQGSKKGSAKGSKKGSDGRKSSSGSKGRSKSKA